MLNGNMYNNYNSNKGKNTLHIVHTIIIDIVLINKHDQSIGGIIYFFNFQLFQKITHQIQLMK